MTFKADKTSPLVTFLCRMQEKGDAPEIGAAVYSLHMIQLQQHPLVVQATHHNDVPGLGTIGRVNAQLQLKHQAAS